MTTIRTLESVSAKSSSWLPITLREAGVALLDCEHRTPAAATEGYPYVAIPQIKNGRLDLSDVRKISKDDFVEWTKKAHPRAFDVILSRRCNPGETALVPHGLECALGQNLVLLRADGSKVFPPFLRWLVRGPEWWEQIGKFINVGAIFDSLRCADVPTFKLTIPPLAQQHRIASILGALDDKIDLNRRMNETLEAMARALFQSWFIDFDPVHAKAAVHRVHPDWTNEQISRAALPNLDAATAELFPDQFEESTIGPLPSRWVTQPLYQIADFVNGAAFKNEDFCDPLLGRPVVKIVELKSGITTQTKYSQKNVGVEREITCGDLLYSWSGSPDTSLDAFRWTGPSGLLNQHIFKVDTKSNTNKIFAYYLLKHLRPVLVEIARDKQTTGLGHVTVADMRRLMVPSVPDQILKRFAATASPLFKLSFDLELQSLDLVRTRDSLLPKLLSGELAISDVQS